MANTFATPPFIPGNYNVAPVRPLVYSDGITILEYLKELQRWLNSSLVEHLNIELEKFGKENDRLIEAVEQQLADQTAEFNDILQQVINNSIELQDVVVAGIVNDANSLGGKAVIKRIESSNGINVKDYGATGDGVTDDTLAILAAQAVANYPPKTLFFPNGRYVMTDSLKAQVIRGESRQRSIIMYQGTDAAVGAMDTPVMQRYHRRIEDLTIQGNGSGVGLDLDSSSNGMFSRLLVTNFDRGVHLRSSLGIPAQCLYNTFFDVIVQQCNGYAYTLDDISNENRFIACRVNQAKRGFQINSGNRNIISECAVEEISERGVSIADSVPGANLTRGNVIANNRFENEAGGASNAITINPGVMWTQVISNRMVYPATYVNNGIGTVTVLAEGGGIGGGAYVTGDLPTNIPTTARGVMVYDTTTKRPVWWDGFNWRDATGTQI